MTTPFKYAATLLLSSVCALAHGEGLTTQEKFDALAAKGIITGTSADAAIDQNMNRAQFARVAALLMGLEAVPSPPQQPNFSDTSRSSWDIANLQGADQTPQSPEGVFSPGGDVSLQDLAKLVVELLELDQNMDNTPNVPGASDWAQGYIKAAVEAGIMPGFSDYTQPATREQLINAAFTASVAILGDQVLDQNMVDPTDANPEGEVTNQDLAGMLGADTDQTTTDSGAADPDAPPESNDNLAWTDQIANEVLIGQLVEESVVQAATSADQVAMYPYFDAGFVTPISDMPFTGTALYNGRASGAFANGTALNGDLTMVADFSAEQIESSIFFDNNMGAAIFTIQQPGNSFTSVSAASGSYGASLDPNPLIVTGVDINGMFYGPAAEEVGGTWGIDFDSGSASADGTFNGKR
ncbi:transferrin-binding protein-like solute binding protein [Pollutimonas thiosulfatoxidans]|uniref:Uncharacterized protein n=1 Tax=Pollutimonas thiosulfatoxidans TaxID=2028345 RepID=A0A410GEK1_9BURK|nr:transferrin-binding protein-like solute binding protein [Pollutimonas thiosulfatoxidans]QAA94723.1 hypothetical protein CKA81_13375 [Pollutimonas thiosulfatoxidans]